MVLDESRSIAEVARATGVNAGTLRNWVGWERTERAERAGLTSTSSPTLLELWAECELRMERDLLNRSLAFWVSETSTPLRVRRRPEGGRVPVTNFSRHRSTAPMTAVGLTCCS